MAATLEWEEGRWCAWTVNPQGNEIRSYGPDPLSAALTLADEVVGQWGNT